MTLRPRSLALTAFWLLVLLFSRLSSLGAQSPRDSLAAGRRAYEQVDYGSAARLLAFGLSSAAVPRDSVWTSGLHMLADALLDQGKDSLAMLWARWASRTVPGFLIDSNAFPPRVARTLMAARAAIGSAPGSDSMVATTLEPAGETATERGQLRLARSPASALAVVEGLGTMLPGESRTVAAGVYSIRITGSGAAALTVTREVLPGFATVLTPRVAAAVSSVPGSAPGRPAAPPPATSLPGVRGRTLNAAGLNTCVVLDTGSISCWGDNTSGELGGGFADSAWHNPVTIAAGAEPFRAVSLGATHACALTLAGRAYCWGLGTNGELGHGQNASSNAPVAVAGGQVFVQIAAGGAHSCGLTRSAAIFCWGTNRSGQIGNRTAASSNVPTAVAAPNGVSFTAISAGTSHTCALASNGSVYCWGANGAGQIGTGTTSDASAPTAVQAATSFRAVTAGGAHTCALASAGTPVCWGANGSGQVGGVAQGSAESTRPQIVPGGLVFDSLEAGEAHTCGLTADGAAYCWGAGRSGQLGNGQAADSPRPVLVVGGHVFRSLSLGTVHSCGMAADGITRCWGSNANGQVGSLGGRGSATPLPVLVRPAPRAVPAGLQPTAAVRERFDDGDWTSLPAWSVDSSAGVRLALREGALEVARRGSHGGVLGAGLSLPVRIPVTRSTQVQFDVQVLADSARAGCGLNCASWPAIVRLRVKNSDLTESEIWYAFSDQGGASRTLGSVIIVARGDVPTGQWLREQRFTIRDAAPRADTILQVSVGGIGGDFAARFDNFYLPVPQLAKLDVKPDSVVLTAAAPTVRLRATAKDGSGVELPWTRVAWSSSEPEVARVDSLGNVTAARTGRTIIHANAGGISDSAQVHVQMTPAPAPARAPAPTPAPRPRRPGRP